MPVAKLGAILLAAGASRRMGTIKQLLPVQGEPAVRHCLGRMLDAGIEHIVVVLGANRQKIRPVVNDLPVDIAVNVHPNSHMSASVSTGLTCLPAAVTGVLVALCDHPLVSTATYQFLNGYHHLAPDSILLPEYRGRGGHPTVFPRDLSRLADYGIPLNRVVHENSDRVRRIALDAPGITQDMDTPEDYRRLLRLTESPFFTAMG